MNLLDKLLENYQSFEEIQIKDRFFKHNLIGELLDSISNKEGFSIEEAGLSTMGRSIHLIKWGNGPCKVFLWSQMHGNEATATMALIDLLNFLSQNRLYKEIIDSLDKNCTLYILPMLNPDGAEIFTRRNAMEIDINRDFHKQQSPEGRLLRKLRDVIHPHFGFNLHDQSTLWSAGKSGKPATISLLAPAYDKELSINSVRQKAMQVIALMNAALQKNIPGCVGRFNDEYEPRAFGDNFQAAGTSTILIEAGGFYNDPEKQYIRKMYFKAILAGLVSIANESYLNVEDKEYFIIPENKKLHFDLLLRNCKLQRNGIPYLTDIGLVAVEKINDDLNSVSITYVMNELGDLSQYFSYQEFNCELYSITEIKNLKIDEPADLIVHDGKQQVISIKNGVLTN
ncbi:M14 metallopeptidase family protein [Daejeonella sp.]|jgi:hypothetical protein|uniref:M14 metallopeptidase family protein n=1 Tax=Daejeonella sp. TaxID=2805397 RepID=UPI0037BFBAAC